jgi:hypothetical protein
MNSFAIVCLSCGSTNSFHVEGSLAANEEVHCSHCHKVMGVWGHLSADPESIKFAETRRAGKLVPARTNEADRKHLTIH